MDDFQQQLFFVKNYESKPPKVYVNDNEEWVSLSEDDRFFDNLIDYQNYSPIHSSIIQSKIDLVSGNDIEYIRGTEYRPNDEDDLKDLIDKLTTDLELLGGGAFLIIRSESDKIASYTKMKYMPLSSLRYKKENKKGELTGLYYSDDWQNLDENKPKYIPFYDKDNLTQKSSIYLFKKFHSGYGEQAKYSIYPSYLSGVPSILIQNKIDNFHNSNLDNNMQIGLHVNLVGQQYQDPEKAKAMIKKIQDQYQGDNNAGKTMYSFSKNKDEKTELTTIENQDIDKMFNILDNTSRDKILYSHQVTNPKLVGILTGGELGGNGLEMLSSYQIFLNQVIEPDRALIQKSLNYVLDEIDVEIEIKYENKALATFLPEDLLTQVLSVDEIRNMIGYGEVETDVIDETKNDDDE